MATRPTRCTSSCTRGKTFAEALDTRCFEPDAPNFTPRISGMLTFQGGDFTYRMNILKSADPLGTACVRENFAYPALPGLGHFLHTYITDGNPIPTFRGEPERVSVPEDLDLLHPGNLGRIWMRKTGFPCTPVIPIRSPANTKSV